jgi:hypothetical protein
VRQAHRLFDLAVALIFPDQQIGDSARIVEIASHKPSRDDGQVLAVESRPRADEGLMPATLLSLPVFHRLIPVIILSSKIPLRGCVFKESVNVCTPARSSMSDRTNLVEPEAVSRVTPNA